MQWYVDNILGSGKDKELFYTDAQLAQAYKNYVSRYNFAYDQSGGQAVTTMYEAKAAAS